MHRRYRCVGGLEKVAALLTGGNAHAVSSGWVSNNNFGFPAIPGEITAGRREAPAAAIPCDLV